MLIARRAFQRAISLFRNSIVLQFIFANPHFHVAPSHEWKMRARAIFDRSLFAVNRIYSRFVRAIARFQRKFSVNHTKSAYFQRKSWNVSVKRSFSVRLSANPTDYPENLVGKHLAFSFDSFSDSQEFLLSSWSFCDFGCIIKTHRFLTHFVTATQEVQHEFWNAWP